MNLFEFLFEIAQLAVMYVALERCYRRWCDAVRCGAGECWLIGMLALFIWLIGGGVKRVSLWRNEYFVVVAAAIDAACKLVCHQLTI